ATGYLITASTPKLGTRSDITPCPPTGRATHEFALLCRRG
ncbi:MAG: hypothetical protein JWN00_5944, partial [Actinomycetia bacterium]|nr:hypothetical protein [Actinomycetes bacterium]